ncbi:DUF4345 domain-containing protein [Kutzneria sp. 744]|uniref:DUF4345 domain-containing protein n=1 Tax=Kutzneria sp. (strain 744) TaxID=345341 RepID=UPI0004BB8940|nr:DUF4345 domain-containing protein [Kutzneria sp. 744]
MPKLLKVLLLLMGFTNVAIGVVHFTLGIVSVPGEWDAGATVDSRERFYAAMFIGYGLLWVWAARQKPIRAATVRWLAGIFWLGAAGRLISLAVYGPPQWFQLVLAALEAALPPIYLLLATADERQAENRWSEATA